ncbi:MAG: antA/AntB antirepressor family protein [Magnetococcales bacterium]|nr:antA/AntB antirepressor family protein [Magnetococcales bacterium]
MEVGKDFSTWIKDRIDKFEFMENQDFVLTFPKTGERQKGRSY